MRKLYILFVFLLLCSRFALAQQLLSISPSHTCQYINTPLEPQLYSFKSDTIASLCSSILYFTNVKKNFEIYASNVESVVAIMDSTNGKRYVLYNKIHFMDRRDHAYRVAVLAHEIGHHVNEHRLTAARKAIEEIQADEFMGFALARMGIVRQTAEAIAERYPMTHGSPAQERKAAIVRGYNRGEASIILAPNAALEDDGSGNALPGIPEFRLPPPQASATYPLGRHLTSCKTMGEVENKLVQALDNDNCGYYERRLFFVRNGFALVTQIEQVQENGYCLAKNRWNTTPVREETFSLLGFIESLLTSKPGYFRVFVFLFTNDQIVRTEKRTISREEAMVWMKAPYASKLPPEVARIPFSQNTNALALVYEFQVSPSDHKAKLNENSMIGAEAHMKNSKILSYLPK